MQSHKEAVGLSGKFFLFFNDLALVFTKDKAYGNTMGDIEDDEAQHEQDVSISLEEGVGLSHS